MKKAIIGKKVGMTQIFDETGKVVPVTVIEAGPCKVVQKKSAEKEGYASVQLGFEEIPALGEDFDPEKHNAVMREQSDEPGKVLEVFQKGYRVKDKIIRYAMVKVSVE